MAYVKLYNFKENGERQEHLVKLNRVPHIGEAVYLNGRPRQIITVLHLPLSESNSIDATCRTKD